MGSVLSCSQTLKGNNCHLGRMPGGYRKIFRRRTYGSRRKHIKSTYATFVRDIMRRCKTAVNTQMTHVSTSLAISVWHMQAVQKLKKMQIWAKEKINNERSRRNGLLLMGKLSDVRVLVDKAWEEKDLSACLVLEDKLNKLNELYNPSGAMECLLLQTEKMIDYMTTEVLGLHMLWDVRRGVVSQGDMLAVRKKTMDARVSLDAAATQRDWDEVYLLNIMVSAMVKPFQQKYQRTDFVEVDGSESG